MRSREWKWSAGIALLVMVACGDDAMEMIGDAMVDVGTSIRDARSDASAQPAMEGVCEVVGTTTQTFFNAAGEVLSENVARTYAARFEVDFDPSTIATLRAYTCGLRATPPTCGPDSDTPTFMCRTTVGPELDCADAGVSFEGRSVVVQCGYSQTNGATNTERRFTTAHLVR